MRRDDDLFRGSEPLQAHDRASRDGHDSEKKDGLLGGDSDSGDDDSGADHGDGSTGHGDEAKDTDSDTTDARSLDGKD